MADNLISFLEQNGWKTNLNEQREDSSSNEILKEYSNLPPEFIEMIEKYQCIVSEDDTVWFLCNADYNNETECAFKWNEFELMSLDAAQGDDDWQKEIEEWWSDKLPIVLSVRDGYSYYAIDTGNGGTIINGWEPEFEEADVVAENFADFVSKIISGEIVL